MAAAREGKVNQMLDELTSLRAHVEVMRKKLALSKDIEALNLGSASQHCCGSTCNTQQHYTRATTTTSKRSGVCAGRGGALTPLRSCVQHDCVRTCGCAS
jgi:hypothetical protein